MSKILVVSDDADLRGQVEQALRQEEATLVGLKNVDNGLERVHQEAPDLVLLDRRLPGMEGGELLKRLAKDPVGMDVPIVLLGEFRETEEQLEFLDLGASEVVSLPLAPAALMLKARSLLRLKARLDRFKAQALIDELTGVFNRRYLEVHLGAKLGEAKRYHQPFSFILFDLDHFKKINDTLGHPFGDLVLHETARLVRNQMRREDVLTRYGGEEFAIFLPHTDLEGAVILAERIRRAVADHLFIQGEKQAKITVSLGVASYPDNDFNNAEELVACADRRLYRAKEGGRNRLVSSG